MERAVRGGKGKIGGGKQKGKMRRRERPKQDW